MEIMSKEDVEDAIKQAIDSPGTSIRGEAFMCDVMEATELFGNEEPPETNGWQTDYWVDFDVKGITVNVSGSGYYGTFSLEAST